MIRRRLPSLVAVTALALLLAPLLLGGTESTAQDLLPTPKGQLGGAPSLETPVDVPEETAPPTPDDETDTPDASECRVAPRSIDQLIALGATPVATSAAVDGTPTELADAGEVSPEDEAGIAETVRELVACSNAGEILRVWSLYSDDYIRFGNADVFVSADQRGGRLNPDVLEEFADGSPTRQDPMPEIHGVSRLADGRVLALLVAPPGASLVALGSAASVLDVAFVWQDRRWRVDETRIVRRG